MDIQQLQQAASHSSAAPISNKNTADEPFWGKDGFTFDDVLDMFNPLHHLPVVSKFYREESHDEACEGSKLLGGVLFGGLLGGVTGVVSSIANAAIRHETHQDMSEHLIDIAENSLESMTDDAVKKTDKTAHLSNSTDTNPFFAQILHDSSDREFYSNPGDQHLAYRKRDWGKV